MHCLTNIMGAAITEIMKTYYRAQNFNAANLEAQKFSTSVLFCLSISVTSDIISIVNVFRPFRDIYPICASIISFLYYIISYVISRKTLYKFVLQFQANNYKWSMYQYFS